MDNNLKTLLNCFYILVIVTILLFVMKAWSLAGVSVYDACNGFLSCGSTPYVAPLLNGQVDWTQEMENKRLESLKPKKDKPKVEKTQEKPKESKTDVDLDKLARAVAHAETGNCTEGYAITHNNCHGIKSGNTYKCPGAPKGKMCKFKDKEESFTAFKVIWGKWYKTMPNLRIAKIWTGDDRKETWLYNVNHHYNKLK